MKKYITVLILCVSLSGIAFCEGARTVSWHDALIETMEKNPALKKASEQVKTAQYGYLSSYSGFLPQISANASGNKSGAFNSNSDPSSNWSLGVSGSLSLFNGFKDKSSVSIKSLEMKSADADYKRALSDVVYELKQSYTELLWSQETVVLSEEILKQRNNNFQLVKLKYEAGIEDKGSLSRVQADKLQAEYDLSKAKRHAGAAVSDLLKAIGTDEYVTLTATGSFSVSSAYGDFAGELDRFLKYSYKETPEYVKAENNFKKAELEKTYSMGDFYPDLSLSAGAADSSNKVGSGDWTHNNAGWNAGLRLSYPIFNGGQRYFNLKTASANKRIAEETLKQARYNLLSQYKAALNNFYDAFENIKVSEKYLEASREQSQVTTAKYINGLATYQEWYSVENDFINSKKSFLNARKNSVITEAAMRNIAGLSEGQQ